MSLSYEQLAQRATCASPSKTKQDDYLTVVFCTWGAQLEKTAKKCYGFQPEGFR
jgi:hypothetical protein